MKASIATFCVVAIAQLRLLLAVVPRYSLWPVNSDSPAWQQTSSRNWWEQHIGNQASQASATEQNQEAHPQGTRSYVARNPYIPSQFLETLSLAHPPSQPLETSSLAYSALQPPVTSSLPNPRVPVPLQKKERSNLRNCGSSLKGNCFATDRGTEDGKKLTIADFILAAEKAAGVPKRTEVPVEESNGERFTQQRICSLLPPYTVWIIVNLIPPLMNGKFYSCENDGKGHSFVKSYGERFMEDKFVNAPGKPGIIHKVFTEKTTAGINLIHAVFWNGATCKKMLDREIQDKKLTAGDLISQVEKERGTLQLSPVPSPRFNRNVHMKSRQLICDMLPSGEWIIVTASKPVTREQGKFQLCRRQKVGISSVVDLDDTFKRDKIFVGGPGGSFYRAFFDNITTRRGNRTLIHAVFKDVQSVAQQGYHSRELSSKYGGGKLTTLDWILEAEKTAGVPRTKTPSNSSMSSQQRICKIMEVGTVWIIVSVLPDTRQNGRFTICANSGTNGFMVEEIPEVALYKQRWYSLSKPEMYVESDNEQGRAADLHKVFTEQNYIHAVFGAWKGKDVFEPMTIRLLYPQT